MPNSPLASLEGGCRRDALATQALIGVRSGGASAVMAEEAGGGFRLMRGALGGPGVLLRRLREVMAASISPQERLDRLVVLIAGNLVAEVCSVYVLREDGSLELYATEGLNREAVHLTTMRAGEGLVGLIAREAEPLALSDAQNHPAFSYRPETGEEIYHSFLGVPILRGGAVMGVLVIQNRATRLYTEEEVETLQTTAMIMAEMIAAGGLKSLAAPGASIGLDRPIHGVGVALADGVGLGHAVLHEPRVAITNLIAENPAGEVKRLEAAIARDARLDRRAARARRRRPYRRAPRRARDLPHVRP